MKDYEKKGMDVSEVSEIYNELRQEIMQICADLDDIIKSNNDIDNFISGNIKTRIDQYTSSMDNNIQIAEDNMQAILQSLKQSIQQYINFDKKLSRFINNS